MCINRLFNNSMGGENTLSLYLLSVPYPGFYKTAKARSHRLTAVCVSTGQQCGDVHVASQEDATSGLVWISEEKRLWTSCWLWPATDGPQEQMGSTRGWSLSVQPTVWTWRVSAATKELRNFRIVFRKSLLKTQRHISQGFLYGKKALPEQLAFKVTAALTQVSVTPWDWSLLDPERPAEMRGNRVGREDGELRMQEKVGKTLSE